MKKSLLVIGSLFTIGTTVAQITLIPDANFEQALVNQGKDFDGVVNGQMATSNAVGVYYLDITNANISDLTGIEAFVDLLNLSANFNNLTNVNLSQNTSLQGVSLASNQLASFYEPTLNQLQELTLSANPISALDVTVYPNLNSLITYNCNYVTLDLSQNPVLTTVGLINNNLLESIDVRNGNSSAITFFSATGAPNLTCVFVDDVGASNLSNWQVSGGQFVANQAECDALNNPLLIPDANFEQELIDLGIDSDNTINGQMSILDALTETYLNVSNKNISDLTGIEGFTNLTFLNCSSNNLSSLNLNSNIELQTLNAVDNELTSMDLSNLQNLIYLQLSNNLFTAIDVSNNVNLKYLTVINCQLTAIDVSSNPALLNLDFSSNAISTIDLSMNPLLADIRLTNCLFNQLNVSNLDSLKVLMTINNPITSIDIRNGYNSLITNFNASNNTSLSCIFVDDENASYLTTWNVPPTSTFVSTDQQCTILSGILMIPDVNFEQALIDLNIDTDNTINGQMSTSDALIVTDLNVSSSTISDLTGIEGFTNLVTLNCSDNQLIALNLNSNTELQNLNCGENQISTLDVSALTNLETIQANDNLFTAMNLSNNSVLTIIDFSSNSLVNLDVRNGNNAAITNFNATTNDDLTCIFVDDENATFLTTWNVQSTSTFVANETQCDNLLSLEDINLDYSVYPNPFTSALTISSNETQGYSILDINGKQLLNGRLNIGLTNVKTSDLSPGMYFFQIENGSTSRIIKK